MRALRRPQWVATAVVALLVLFGAAAYYLMVSRPGDARRGSEEPGTEPPTPGDATRMATASATRFLHRYVDPDGRVVRRDQGGDTVSEGQAYALLAAVAVGDRSRFQRVWEWTRTHLERHDALSASHWDEGQIVDPQPAADADLDTARALLLAAERFQADRYHDQAAQLAAAIIQHETAGQPSSRCWSPAPGRRSTHPSR